MKFGKYEIIKEIGKGAMGVVYLAFDPVIERQVAIKTMNPQLFQDKEQRERFFREAKSAGILQHPNIVTIYDMGMEGDTPFIVMEYVEGKDLDSLIKEKKVSLDVAIKIMIQLCDALHYAHAKGIIHRDIKPSNIRVLPDGTIKIMDFGIAKKTGSDLTQTGVLLGTVSYMAPEQLKEGKVSPRSDQFSAGIVFYEMLSGTKCFQGDTITSVMYKIVSFNEQQIDLQTVPQNIVSVLKKMVSHDPDKRFNSCGEVSALLKSIEDVPTVIAEKKEFSKPLPPPVPQQDEKTVFIPSERQAERKNSYVWIFLFFFIFLLVFIGGAYYVYNQHQKKLAVLEHNDNEEKKINIPVSEVKNVNPEQQELKGVTETKQVAENIDKVDNKLKDEKKTLPEKQKLFPDKRKVLPEKPFNRKKIKKRPKRKKIPPPDKVKEKEVFSYVNEVKKKEKYLNFMEAQEDILKDFLRQTENLPYLEKVSRSNSLFNVGMKALGNGANRFAAINFYKSILLNPKRKEAYSFLCVALARIKAFDDINKVIKKAQDNGISLYELRKNKLFDRVYNRLIQKGLID